MLISAMDISGNSIDNYSYLAIIIGVQDNIDSLFKKMGNPTIHLSGINPKKRNKIIKEIKFDCNVRIAFCIRIERGSIMKNIQNLHVVKKSRISKGRLFAIFEKALFKYVRHEIEEFTLKHNTIPNELIMECDGDSVIFAKTLGVKKIIKPSNSHAIADAVAWCNHKKIPIFGCVESDLRKKIMAEMIKKIGKKKQNSHQPKVHRRT